MGRMVDEDEDEEDGDNFDAGQQAYEKGTPVFTKNDDGTFMGGTIIDYSPGYYIIHWETSGPGEYQTIEADDADLDRMVDPFGDEWETVVEGKEDAEEAIEKLGDAIEEELEDEPDMKYGEDTFD